MIGSMPFCSQRKLHMRRIIALILTLLFSLQSTASAAVPGQMHGPDVQPLLSAIENTFVFALITGQASRYEAMHAPAPERLRINPNYEHPDFGSSRPAQGTFRYGQRVSAPAMSSRVFLPKDAPRDPLLTKKSGPIAVAVANGVKPMICPQTVVRGRLLVGCPGLTPSPSPRSTPTPVPTPTPTPVPTPTPTPVPTPTPTPVPTPTPTPVPTPTPIPVTPTPVPTATPVVAAMPTPNTGINPWWTYQEKPLAGIGTAMVNVANWQSAGAE